MNPLLDLLELVEAHLWLEFRFDSSCFEEVILDQSLEGTILFVLLPCLFLLSVQELRLGRVRGPGEAHGHIGCTNSPRGGVQVRRADGERALAGGLLGSVGL